MWRRSFTLFSKGVTSYLTDVEGSSEFFDNFISVSKVLRLVDNRLEFVNEDDRFVFGGDCFDRGTGDLRIARLLADLKNRYPHRVDLLMGNRDINKMKLTAELHHTELSRRPEDVPRPFYIPSGAKYFSFADYVAKHNIPPAEHHSAVHRLKWMLSHTMGCVPTFELRRKELAITAGHDLSAISDEDVVQSYLDSLKPGGAVAEYLRAAQPVAIVEDSIFVHGAVNKYCVGFVPSLTDVREQPYFSDDDLGAFGLFSEAERIHVGSAPIPGHDIIRHEGASIKDWVRELNVFAHKGVEEWLAQPYFDSPELPPPVDGGGVWGRRRGGTALLAYPHRSAMGKKTCVISTFVRNGSPMHVDLGTVACLNAGGVTRVIVGHQPSGTSPTFISQPGVKVICADTSYCAAGINSHANDRGHAVAEVLIDSVNGKVTVNGRDVNGTRYSFDVSDHDDIIGRRTADGWWSKAYRNNDTEVLMQHTKNAFYTTTYEWIPVGIARHRLQEGVVVGGCGGSINWGLTTTELRGERSPAPKTLKTKVAARDYTHQEFDQFAPRQAPVSIDGGFRRPEMLAGKSPAKFAVDLHDLDNGDISRGSTTPPSMAGDADKRSPTTPGQQT